MLSKPFDDSSNSRRLNLILSCNVLLLFVLFVLLVLRLWTTQGYKTNTDSFYQLASFIIHV